MARQISYDAARAFECGRTFKRSNTRVTVEGGYWVLELFGNNIARYPVDGSWDADGEITTCGWQGMCTNDRLNALSGVSMWGHDGVFLHGWPWDGDWVSKHGVDPEKSSRQLAKEREEVMDRISDLGDTNRMFHRKRKGEVIAGWDVRLPRPAKPGTHAEIVARPWKTKPSGEIIVGDNYYGLLRREVFRFACWRHFDRALQEACTYAAPDLVKLGQAAKEILSAAK